MSEQAVVVTTKHRGVFFGYLVGEASAEKVTLKNARNCIRWQGIRGFIALAESGPGDQCRVGPAAPEVTLYDITSVATATEQATKAWEAAPWAR